MYEILYQYLIRHRKMPLAGIGTLQLERKAAQLNFAEKQAEPPSYSVQLLSADETPELDFYSWLGGVLQVSDREAIIRYNDFSFALKKELREGSTIDWKGVGRFSQGLAGDIRFVADAANSPEAIVPAEKVIRDKSSHTVRVGEDERSSEEMEKLLSGETATRDYWWAWALVAGLLAVSFAGWHFSENGIGGGATANPAKLVPAESTVTYRLLP